MMQEKNPLVSVRIITYNSSETILETLESVKAQTYKNIELIISDDCSIDNTVEICQKWIEINKNRFTDTKLLTSLKNLGVCANANKTFNVATGEWTKGLAADDCLVRNAIEEYIKYVQDNRCEICAAGMIYINDKSELINDDLLDSTYRDYLNDLKKSHKRQLNIVSRKIIVPGPALFFSRKMFQDVGGYSIEYPFADEWPFQFRLLNKGYRIFPLNEMLIKYRVHEGSLCRQNFISGYNPKVTESTYNFISNELVPTLTKNGRFYLAWECFIMKCVMINKKYRFLKLLSFNWYSLKLKSYLKFIEVLLQRLFFVNSKYQ